jgi:hypothetical protein
MDASEALSGAGLVLVITVRVVAGEISRGRSAGPVRVDNF